MKYFSANFSCDILSRDIMILSCKINFSFPATLLRRYIVNDYIAQLHVCIMTRLIGKWHCPDSILRIIIVPRDILYENIHDLAVNSMYEIFLQNINKLTQIVICCFYSCIIESVNVVYHNIQFSSQLYKYMGKYLYI